MTDRKAAAIKQLLRPNSIAIVGASDRSRWSAMAFDNLTSGGFTGEVHLVNRRGERVHNRNTAQSCAALGREVDLGIVLVPAAGVGDALRDLSHAKARNAIILTSGFAEIGEAGRRQQHEIAEVAAALDIRLLGPNCLGFINFVDDIRVWTTPVRAPSRKDGVAIVSQSGATALFLSELAYQQDIGLSFVVSTGNEADLDVTAFIDHLVDDPSTRAIALFIETVRDPERFLAAAEKALDRGKPLVVLKVGASEATARTAVAHTGALVGDDKVFDGLCKQFAIIRTRSIEDLLATADIVARTGPLRSGGLCVVSNSGGICEIAADTADHCGIALPELPSEIADALRQSLPGYATPHNPLDATGGLEPEQCGPIIETLSAHEAFSAILCPWYEIPTGPEQRSERLTQLHGGLSKALNASPIPGFLVSYTNAVVTEHSRAIIADLRAPYLACGLDRAVRGLASALWWSARYRSRGEAHTPVEHAPARRDRPCSERESLEFLSRCGVPVVPMTLATNAESAVSAARQTKGPVVLKIAARDIPHKSDMGGVVLNLMGDAAVGAAYAQIMSAARAHAPAAHIDGILVAPMRERGLELLVGCSRDPQWGLVLAVGLGGIFVEVLKDVALRILPVSIAEIHAMLAELRGAKLLDGQRGIPAAGRDHLADAIFKIAEAALSLGSALQAVDVNPLWVRGDRIEALDALFVWNEPSKRSPFGMRIEKETG